MAAVHETRLRVAALAAVAAVLALAPVGAAARETTVGAGAVLQMSGSDIYCTVVKSGRITVACFHLPGGPSSSKRKGWAIFGSDQYAGVTPSGTNTPKKLLAQPSFASVPAVSGQAGKSTMLVMAPGDLAAVKGTHMGIYVSKLKTGGDAIGVIYLGVKGNPVGGEITAAISNQYVSLVKVSAKGVSSLVYRHAVY